MDPRLFDVYIAIDWSARSKRSPRKESPNSVWLGEYVVDNAGHTETRDEYCQTRHECQKHLIERLKEHVAHGRRVFVGFDFAFGYPAGTAAAFGLDGGAAPWRALWETLAELIEDGPDNQNNRFQVAAALNARCGAIATGPLWGCHKSHATDTLTPTRGFEYPYPIRPGISLAEKRITESGQTGAQPTWKLFGNGSVGGQTLLGIPVIHRLRHLPELSAFSRIVPFETGFTRLPTPERGPWIAYVEIYPGVLGRPPQDTSIANRWQVRTYVECLAKHDDAGTLGALFDRPKRPDGREMEAAQIDAILSEEGWILGVK